jgi:hypothetical protein
VKSTRGRAVAAVLVALVLGGCGGAAGASGSSTTTAPIQYMPTTTTLAPAAAATSVPVEPACTTPELRIETIAPINGTGWEYAEVVVGVNDHARCSLDGYPQAEMYVAGPHGDVPLSLPVLREQVTGNPPMGTAPTRIDVGPQVGDTSAFFVAFADRPATSKAACHVAEGLALRLPGSPASTGEVTFVSGSSGPADETGPLQECARDLWVTAFESPILPDISG